MAVSCEYTFRALEHPNICMLRGAINWEGSYTILLDYIPGGSLADALIRLRASSGDEVSTLLKLRLQNPRIRYPNQFLSLFDC